MVHNVKLRVGSGRLVPHPVNKSGGRLPGLRVGGEVESCCALPFPAVSALQPGGTCSKARQGGVKTAHQAWRTTCCRIGAARKAAPIEHERLVSCWFPFMLRAGCCFGAGSPARMYSNVRNRSDFWDLGCRVVPTLEPCLMSCTVCRSFAAMTALPAGWRGRRDSRAVVKASALFQYLLSSRN